MLHQDKEPSFGWFFCFGAGLIEGIRSRVKKLLQWSNFSGRVAPPTMLRSVEHKQRKAKRRIPYAPPRQRTILWMVLLFWCRFHRGDSKPRKKIAPVEQF